MTGGLILQFAAGYGHFLIPMTAGRRFGKLALTLSAGHFILWTGQGTDHPLLCMRKTYPASLS